MQLASRSREFGREFPPSAAITATGPSLYRRRKRSEAATVTDNHSPCDSLCRRRDSDAHADASRVAPDTQTDAVDSSGWLAWPRPRWTRVTT
ncbi:hypothetical protein IEO21_03680 [Rhodonia placenta]|uniref:Uncharacterized protein n=1 Tax=Rhodonia placenta TaxID=104341 RepID=A0A8H7U385_9APHY|nr:hypothetical protein IEO21_03680 [Postia placenta]